MIEVYILIRGYQKAQDLIDKVEIIERFRGESQKDAEELLELLIQEMKISSQS